MKPPLKLLAAAIVTAVTGAVTALLGDAAAGVALVGLAVAMTCTAVRHHLRKDPRR